MDVRIDRQTRGIVHPVPRPSNGQPPATRAATADAGPRPQLFDANSDGVIENWSIAHGGDSFATFDPPPSGTTGSDTKPCHGTDALPTPTRVAGHGTGHPTTPAAVHHAHDAYQRDGLGASVPASPPAATAPAPAPAAPAPAPTTKRPSS